MNISFRPHHFLCALCFQGQGYSPSFIKNFTELMSYLNQNGDDTVIEIVSVTDSICSPCPHRQEQSCATEEKIIVLDHAHAKALGIKPGEKITWGEAKHRIKRQMTLPAFHEACVTCSWKSLGICEQELSKFITK